VKDRTYLKRYKAKSDESKLINSDDEVKGGEGKGRKGREGKEGKVRWDQISIDYMTEG
jgi:hypothetical protein